MRPVVFYLIGSFILLGTALRPALAKDVKYAIEMKLQSSDLALESAAEVQVKIAATDLKAGSCLYIGLHDPLVEKAQALRAVRGQAVQDRASRQTGALIQLSSAQLQQVHPYLYRVRALSQEGELSLDYKLALSGWRDKPVSTRLLTQFYPVLLPRCPDEGEEPMFLPSRPAHFQVNVQLPQGWSVLAPGTQSGSQWSYEGNHFSAVLHQNSPVKRSQTSGGQLFILSQSAKFQELAAHAHRAIELFTRITGMRSERDIILVETEDFEPINVPGLIALNRPQQLLMRTIQEDYLHWGVWQLARAIAEQWFGLGIKPASLDDSWLVQGFADHLVLQFVETEAGLSNLFIGAQGQDAYLQFGFRQGQDLQSALLSLWYPQNSLVDADLRSKAIEGSRPSFNFIRHAQALRYLHWLLQEPVFNQWLQVLTKRFRDEAMNPKAVLATLQDVPQGSAPSTLEAGHDLRQFWQSNSWPEIAVGAIHADANGKGATIDILQQSPMRVAFDVSVKSKAGVRFQQRMRGDSEVLSLKLDIPAEDIEDIEIDPQRAIFDKDRFNNTDRWPHFTLFPGNARTIHDDAYTVVWLPLASKLPGQSLSLQLSWQVRRYVGSSISGFMTYQPEHGVWGYSLAYKQNISDYGLTATFAIAQDDGRTLANERIWDLKLQKMPLFSDWSSLVGSTRLRLRHILGQPEKNHMTSAVGFNYKGHRLETCSWDLNGEYEWSSWVPDQDFNYARTLGAIRAGCENPWLQLKLRGFQGATRSRGPVPGGAFFQAQNLDEARFRLDRPKLPLVARVRTLNFDLSTPARLPLPESAFVLPRRSLFKVFSDWGILQEPNLNVQATGIGYILPFGGDIVGKSSVTFIQLAIYSVLHRRLGDQIDNKPGFLFDLSGEL